VGSGRILLLVRLARARANTNAVTPLKAKILQHIRERGPISVADYMRMALLDEDHGYYMRGDPFGAAGDFITAPEMSQIFGELIGLFFVQAWDDRRRPKPFHLVEFGPGRGTLMADILRAAKIRPGFGEAAQIVLVEASPTLRAVQRQTLNGARVRWAHGLDDLGEGPCFVIANEFFDALPVQQWVKSDHGWRERTIAARGDALVFARSETSGPPACVESRFGDAAAGSILETGGHAIAAIRAISDRVVRSGGVALMVDYGYAGPSLGDTFQAVKRHAYADPLAEPGEADLTFHVDFAALASAAQGEGARVFGPITQAEFLSAVGIHLRAEKLKRAAPAQANDIDAAVERLTAPKQMGTLFKVMALAAPGSPQLPGFPC
jgi:NADH dehydrogenase [ubiquinone] 1 alpha subcomplex assembly factor 7